MVLKKNHLSNFSSLYLTAWMENVLCRFLIRVTSYVACAKLLEIQNCKKKIGLSNLCHMYLVFCMSNVLWPILIGSQLELRCKTTGNPELHKRARTSGEDMEENRFVQFLFVCIFLAECTNVLWSFLIEFTSSEPLQTTGIQQFIIAGRIRQTRKKKIGLSFLSPMYFLVWIYKMCSADFW